MKSCQFSYFLVRKFIFSKSAAPFSHLPRSQAGRGAVVISVGWLPYSDWSRWTWRPDLRPPTDPLAELDSHDYRRKGGPLTFGEPYILIPSMADHRLGCLSTIVLNIIADKLQVPFSAAMITDSWSIMGCYHRAFPQTQCQQHVNPGQKSCMWSGRWKAAMACRSHRVASQWRTPWAELESSGSCRFDWLCCWACWGST